MTGLVYPTRFAKLPGEQRRFYLDFSPMEEIEVDGNMLTGTPTIAATPSGLSITNPQFDSAYVAAADIAGGSPGVSYLVTFTVTTSAGKTIARSYYIDVRVN